MNQNSIVIVTGSETIPAEHLGSFAVVTKTSGDAAVIKLKESVGTIGSLSHTVNSSDLTKVGELSPETKDYRQMAKAFIGETIQDFFCNGFFGSRNFEMAGARITKIYDDEDDEAIVIEVRMLDNKYDYGYFHRDWRNWRTVYDHLNQWTSPQKD